MRGEGEERGCGERMRGGGGEVRGEGEERGCGERMRGEDEGRVRREVRGG